MDISIVITNYNREKFINRAVNSCLSQLLTNVRVETIVVDDNSTDASLKQLEKFGEKIKIINHKKNKGVAAASNTGLMACNGKYFMRVDSDDFISAYICQILFMLIEANPEYDFVYCDHVRVDEIGRREELIRLNNQETLYKHGAGILFRKSILFDIGLYDENLRNAEDYDLLIRLQKAQKKGFYLPLPLYRYYIHGENMTLNEDRNSYEKIVRDRHGV